MSVDPSIAPIRRVAIIDSAGAVVTPPHAVAQASTTAGQSGDLIQAAVVSGDQAYTAGQTNPLTLTATGRLRVGLSSAGSVEPGTAGTNADLVAGVYKSAGRILTDGQQASLLLDAAGNLKVVGTKLNDGTVTATGGAHLTVGGVNPTGFYLPASVTAAGALYTADMGALDATVRSASVSSGAVGDTFSTAGFGSVSFQVLANASSNTVTIEGSNDGGTTWSAVALRKADGSGSAGSQGTTLTSSGAFIYVPTYVAPQMRWRVSTFIGGTTTIAVGLKRFSSPNVMDVNVGNTSIAVTEIPKSTQGLIAARVTTGASGTGKSGPAQLYVWNLLNTTASIRYFQFYNKTTAGIPGTDTPIYTVPLAANGTANGAPGSGVTIGTTGCSWAITTDAAGATIATSGDVTGSFGTN